jgi:hypothetical protein
MLRLLASPHIGKVVLWQLSSPTTIFLVSNRVLRTPRSTRLYRAAVLRCHPDINSAPNATRLTAMLNEAHRVLSTTVGRAGHDATLSSRATAGLSRDQWPLLGDLSAALFFPWLFAWRIATAGR